MWSTHLQLPSFTAFEREGGRTWRDGFAVPLRLIDDVELAESGGRLTITAWRRVEDGDPQLQAHFPQFRIFPGVFIVEALRQAVARALDKPAMTIVAVRSIRFVAPLLPGDLLTLHASIETRADGVLSVDAEARRNEQEVAARMKIDCAPAGDAAAHLPVLAIGRLPHGHPMLLVDRIVSMAPGQSITAIKAITSTEPCYHSLGAGLSASSYAYPTALLLESFGQTAALLWMEGGEAARSSDEVVVLVGARNCRITGAAYPGDVLTHTARLDYARDGHAIVAGETRVGDRLVAIVESMVASMRTPAVLAQRVAAR